MIHPVILVSLVHFRSFAMSQKWTFYILRYIWGKKIHNSQWVHNEFSLRKVQMKIQHMHSFCTC